MLLANVSIWNIFSQITKTGKHLLRRDIHFFCLINMHNEVAYEWRIYFWIKLCSIYVYCTRICIYYGLIYSVFAYISEMLNMDVFSSMATARVCFFCEIPNEMMKKHSLASHWIPLHTYLHLVEIVEINTDAMLDKQTSKRNPWWITNMNALNSNHRISNKWTTVF